MLAFEKAGMRPIAAPTDYRAESSPLTRDDFLPESTRLEACRTALRECIGIIHYRMTM